jgi:exodeoxyribonuclease III
LFRRIDYRTKEWDPDFRAYLNTLKQQKSVILTGDLNVCHQEIDIKNKNNLKSAGFTLQERAEFTKLLKDGYTDTFRHLYPDKIQYSWFSAWGNARQNNAGWRLDYVVVDNALLPAVKDSKIHNEQYGSDHCPVELELCLNNLSLK